MTSAGRRPQLQMPILRFYSAANIAKLPELLGRTFSPRLLVVDTQLALASSQNLLLVAALVVGPQWFAQ
jgi:hypothetical protein